MDDWQVTLDQLNRLVGTLLNPRSPLVWILGLWGGYQFIKGGLYYFGIYRPESKDQIALMKCKDVRKKLRTCNKSDEKLRGQIIKRVKRTNVLKKKNKDLQKHLKNCVEARARYAAEKAGSPFD